MKTIESRILETKNMDRPYILSSTKKITTEDLVDMRWAQLKKQYDEAEASGKGYIAIATSILNSIIYQNRVHFSVIKKNLGDIHLNDDNFNVKTHKNQTKVLTALDKLIEARIIRITSTIQRRTSYEVIDEDVLRYMDCDVEEQRKEVEDYIIGMKHHEIEDNKKMREKKGKISNNNQRSLS